MKDTIFREITPMEKHKLFYAKYTPDDPMTFPVHFHSDFEITLVTGANGNRIVGDNIKHFEGVDLALIFPDKIHGYRWDPEFQGADVIVIQFSKEIKDYKFFSKEGLESISRMLNTYGLGINFSTETALAVKDRMLSVIEAKGIDKILLFIDILHTLSIAHGGNFPILSSSLESIHYKPVHKDCERINKIILFIEKNYSRKISLKDIAESVQMSPSSLCRYFKRKTGSNLWDYLNCYRIDEAVQKMIKSDSYIFEICYSCGFNNLSNFNKEFKKRLGISPSAYIKKMKEIL